MIKRLLGIVPQPTEDGEFSPSRLVLKLATSPKTVFDGTVYKTTLYWREAKSPNSVYRRMEYDYGKSEKILYWKSSCRNDTSNLHLKNAEFNIEIVTPIGKSDKLEMWAMPEEDENVIAIYSEYKEQFENQKSLSDIVKNFMNESSDYLAVFIP